MEDDLYFKVAKIESEKSKVYQKLGCVIVKKGKILGKGHNRNKTHPKYGSGYHKYLHAEGAALWDAIKKYCNVRGAKVYIFRRNWGLACPCEDCRKLFMRHGIRQVIYSKNFSEKEVMAL